MNLLLDTHLLLWAAARPDWLPPRAAEMINDLGHQLFFSAASLWEIAIKRSLNRPDFRTEAGPMRAGLLANGYHEMAIEGRHCLALSALPMLHGDPFDRMLLAQAVSEGMTLVTADRQIGQYAGPIMMV